MFFVVGNNAQMFGAIKVQGISNRNCRKDPPGAFNRTKEKKITAVGN